MNQNNKSNNRDSFFDKTTHSVLLLDGKIHNLEILLKNLKHDQTYTSLDSNKKGLLLEGLQKYGTDLLKHFIGSYSGIWYNGQELFGFKDPVGAKPLYYLNHEDFFILSSEMKALTNLNTDIFTLSPGQIVSSKGLNNRFYHFPDYIKNYKINSTLISTIKEKLNSLIKESIKDCINEEETTGVLLSGGIDSIIITHIAKSYVKDLNVFSIGVKRSKDLKYAKKYSKVNQLNHHIIRVSFDDLYESIPEVIYALETFDAALIRSSVPMFLLCKYIHNNSDTNILLTGEGGDELFGGYEYLTKIRHKDDLHQELRSLLDIEHKTGLQRVDRIPYYFSIEARAPFFDKRIVEFSFNIPNELKIFKNRYGNAKKWILRKAFESEIQEEFIWRRKQKFSEGAGTQFLLKKHIENLITDKEYIRECQITPNFNVRSKEELYYWRIFKQKFNPSLKTINEIGITSNYEI